MDLSIDPLPAKQRKWLKSASQLGLKNPNKSQYRKMVAHHLDVAIRELYHILPYSHRLNQKQIYDNINSLTLSRIFRIMLEEPGLEYSNKYDFRTVELARTLFETSANYLRGSELVKDNKWANEDIDRVSQSFFDLAKMTLKQHAYETISEKEMHNLEAQRSEFQKLLDMKRSDTKGKYGKHSKEYDRLVDLRRDLDYAHTTLQNNKEKLHREVAELKKKKSKAVKLKRRKSTKQISQIENQIQENRVKDQELARLSIQAQELRDSSIASLEKKIDAIDKKLPHQYDHLKGYFSPLRKLGNFTAKPNPYLPEDDENQIKGI